MSGCLSILEILQCRSSLRVFTGADRGQDEQSMMGIIRMDHRNELGHGGHEIESEATASKNKQTDQQQQQKIYIFF